MVDKTKDQVKVISVLLNRGYTISLTDEEVLNKLKRLKQYRKEAKTNWQKIFVSSKIQELVAYMVLSKGGVK